MCTYTCWAFSVRSPQIAAGVSHAGVGRSPVVDHIVFSSPYQFYADSTAVLIRFCMDAVHSADLICSSLAICF